MSRMLHANFPAKLAGAIVFVFLAVVIPTSNIGMGMAHAETVCPAPLHNDPWIGCVS